MSIPPQKANIHIDSCAFDPKYYPEHEAAEEIYHLFENRKDFILEIAHSVQKEINHPNTPSWVKERANKLGYTIAVDLEEEERKLLREIENILAGNGKVENMRQDAKHIFEANKHGSYFVTTDERILSKKQELFQICSRSLFIVKPSELLSLVRIYDQKKL